LAISPHELLPEALADGWTVGTATAESILTALSKKHGEPLPWPMVRAAIDGAIRSRMLECSVNSGPWPCEVSAAGAVRLKITAISPGLPPILPPVVPVTPGTLRGEAELKHAQIQDLADEIGEIAKLAVGHHLKFFVRLELAGGKKSPAEAATKINELLEKIVKGWKVS
jgi:hypothetical protein